MGLALFAENSEVPWATLLFEPGCSASSKPHATVRLSTWDRDFDAPLPRREHNLRPAVASVHDNEAFFLRLGISSGAVVAAVSSNGSDWIIMDGGPAPPEILRTGIVLNSGSERHFVHAWVDGIALKPSLF
ncbi:MAG TPA: hypothetical protein VGN16_11920 [Acidobacteriaceae bacterium]